MNQATSPVRTKSRLLRQETTKSTSDLQVLAEQPGSIAPVFADCEESELILPIMDSHDLRIRLKQITHAYKQGHFDPQLRTATSNLHDYFQRVGMGSTREYWKGRALLYELNEILGLNSAINDATFEVGRQIREELRILSLRHRGVAPVYSERKILREKILLCGCYAIELGRRADKR